jgi:hypothetical protein
MKFNIEIPDRLKNLKLDDRGFPIPFFVAWVDGKPDFRLLDPDKQRMCAEQHKCAICGTRMRDVYYFLGGPLTCKNQYSTDPAMHRECAEFSLRACPHMFFQKAERNERGSVYQHSKKNPFLIADKPDELYLIKASKYKFVTREGHPMIKFKRVSWDVFEYRDGKLNLDN